MRTRRIVFYWTIFSFTLILGYFFLQVLHSINFWENLGISPAPDHIEPFSTIGMTFFILILVVGWSCLFSVLVWKLIAQIYSPTHPALRLSFELFQSYVSLSFFEIFLYFNFTFFSIFVARNTIPINSQNILELAWINLILVGLFYTFLGLQAYRKSFKIEAFLRKIAYDYLQVTVLTLEGVLILIPFGLVEFLSSLDNYPIALFSFLIYSYNALLMIVIYDFEAWGERKVKREEEVSERAITIRIFLLDTLMIMVPLIVIPTFIVSPFNLPFQSFGLWIFLISFFIIFSIFASMVYTLAKLISPKNAISHWAKLKYRVEVILADRGNVFNYPTPIDIFIGGELTEKIEHRWEKVTLRMACGQCYHVFTADTYKKGSSLKPIPCAFCGSLATTPVWE